MVAATLEIHRPDDVMVTVDVDEWIEARTSTSPNSERLTNLLQASNRNDDKWWGDTIKSFLKRKSVWSIGLYGEGDADHNNGFNTFNNDHSLSDSIAVSLFEWNGERFVIVQKIDYFWESDPIVYVDETDDDAEWYSVDSYSIGCDRCNANWEHIEGYYGGYRASDYNRLDNGIEYNRHQLPPSWVWCDDESTYFHNCAGTSTWVNDDKEVKVFNGGTLSAYGSEY